MSKFITILNQLTEKRGPNQKITKSGMHPDRKVAKADIRKIFDALGKTYVAEYKKQNINIVCNGGEFSVFTADGTNRGRSADKEQYKEISDEKVKQICKKFADELLIGLEEKYSKTRGDKKIEDYEKRLYPTPFYRKGFTTENNVRITVQGAIGGPYATVWVHVRAEGERDTDK